MYLFGHLGLTAGLILLGLYLFNRSELIKEIDFRVIAVFSVLPDLIDKTFGHVIFYETINNGRLFAHTLLFLVIFAAIFYFITGARWWLFTLPVAIHQVFDLLWCSPKIWFWPVYGWQFNLLDIIVWEHWLDALTKNPFVITTEILGALTILIIVKKYRLHSRPNLVRWLKTGKLV